MITTEIYRKIIEHAQSVDEEALDLAHKVWDPTPWVINVKTGSFDENIYPPMREFCLKNFGEESWPIHNKPRNWYRGGVTLFGWTWMGFATKEMMEQFLIEFPQEGELNG